MFTGHPLDDARARVERASKHLTEVASEIEAYRRREYERILVEHDAALNLPNVTVSRDTAFLPHALFLAVSDCIHNLRSALDFLVFELTLYDSGKIQKDTQFLICDNPESFQKRKRKRLVGLSDAHVNGIELYQPYNGAEWTRILRDISNPDKHRHLTPIEGGQLHDVTVKAVPMNLEGLPGKVFKGVGKDRCDVYLEQNLRLTVIFDNGFPVVETLQTLIREVSQVIDSFSSDFEG